ncbi:MAG TPA: DEAD/DEAH box helicase [Candidatus Angelobacter sp.]|nr:DEAD/DEAH box helicase [Candidatus Angelobacter sp.]
MEFAELKELVVSPAVIRKNSFAIAKEICSFYSSHVDDQAAQDIVLRALEQRVNFGKSKDVLDALAREIGLFPYLDPTRLSAMDQIAYEMHRFGEQGKQVFHVRQNAVFQVLLQKKNVILSAPPSFGKSLLIDALILQQMHDNVLIVVPTIALIDETRRRLVPKVREAYKVITHHSQIPARRNIFIYTQERVVEQPPLEHLDLLVIDEFYKLNPDREDDERWAKLNAVLYQYAKKATQIYLLGPNVGEIDPALLRSLKPEVFDEEYRTVAAEVHDETKNPVPLVRLVELCRSLTDPTIIFCSSPEKAMLVAKELIAGGIRASSPESEAAAAWVAKTYHPEWHFGLALRQGIGVHHGRIPRSLAQFLVRAFDECQIQFLVCTSTLIEGVNTKARNMIIFDHTIDRKNIDRFTFNNIMGRSGRMGRYFVGHVYLFHDAPQDELPRIEVPAFSQTDAASDILLMRLEETELTDASRERLRRFREQNLVPYELLRENDIDPESQLKLAAEIKENLEKYAPSLRWRTIPRWEDLLLTCQLIWRHFDGRRKAGHSASSPDQLAYFLNKLKSTPSTHDWIHSQYLYWKDADRAVTKILDFYRLWAGVHFPRLLRILDRIQKHLLGTVGKEPGDYELFATKVQNLFLPPFVADLDEYGIPLELARKLAPQLAGSESLDELFQKVRQMDLRKTDLERFERQIIEIARAEM